MSNISAASKKSVRNYLNCRINCLDLDPHVICINCRGKSCNMTDMCDMCVDFDDIQMIQYLKHQASLERKRKSKEKAKSKTSVDFATLCTVVSDGDVALSDDGVFRDGLLEGSISLLAGSASGHNMEEFVTPLIFVYRVIHTYKRTRSVIN